MKRGLIDLTGQTFGDWKVIERAPFDDKNRVTLWRCRCACGTRQSIRSKDLRSGHSTRCASCRGKALAEATYRSGYYEAMLGRE